MKNNLLKILEKEMFEDETQEGDLVTFNNTVDDMPLKIEADEGNEIEVRNKNILDITPTSERETAAGANYQRTTSSFMLKGTTTGTWLTFRLKNIFNLKAGMYTFSKKISGTCPKIQIKLNFYNENNKVVKTFALPTSLDYTNVEFSEDEITQINYIDFIIESLLKEEEYDMSCTLQLEQGSEATDYIEHQSQTFTSTGEPIVAKSYDNMTQVFGVSSIKATAKISKIRELEDKINE